MTRRPRIVVTGANGFIGRNLCVQLGEQDYDDVRPITRDSTHEDLKNALTQADFVFHLAGVNRPEDISEFRTGNEDFTRSLCDLAAKAGRPIPIAYTSSIQATLDNPYGVSKRAAEEIVFDYGRKTGSTVHVLRLPNVFGKWAQPDYNSAIATFCHNIARGLPITVNDPKTPLRIVYIDDVVSALIELLASPRESGFVEAGPVYETTLGEVVDTIRAVAAGRRTLDSDLARTLHATYLSYLASDRARSENIARAAP